jgi:hypothetical protein
VRHFFNSNPLFDYLIVLIENQGERQTSPR